MTVVLLQMFTEMTVVLLQMFTEMTVVLLQLFTEMTAVLLCGCAQLAPPVAHGVTVSRKLIHLNAQQGRTHRSACPPAVFPTSRPTDKCMAIRHETAWLPARTSDTSLMRVNDRPGRVSPCERQEEEDCRATKKLTAPISA